MGINIKRDNTDAALDEMHGAVERALEIVGMKMEGYAKLNLTESDAVDTGRLRNSISHATRYNTESKPYKWGKSSKGRGTKEGSDVTEPRVTPKPQTVVVGTNVEYARVIELGTANQAPRPYLKPAVTEHLVEYKQIINKELKND